MSINSYIPLALKRFIRLNTRRVKDMFTTTRFAAVTTSNTNSYKEIISINQQIKKTDTAVNKIHNLQLAINRLNNIKIMPGETFSFWKLLGDSSEKNGYKKSRSIVNGELEGTVGGGLCQLSGLIYFLALQSGLIITERHPHSIDIYTEEERFTPLGSDATVSYGYKDLRFINNLSCDIVLQFELTSTALSGQLLSTEKTVLSKIEFLYKKEPMQTHVTTLRYHNDQPIILNESTYRLLTNT